VICIKFYRPYGGHVVRLSRDAQKKRMAMEKKLNTKERE